MWEGSKAIYLAISFVFISRVVIRLFRLLLRLYKLDKGNIYIDGINIYEYSKQVYSSNVSIVTQKPFIFNMSIRENFNLVDSNRKHQIEACKKIISKHSKKEK